MGGIEAMTRSRLSGSSPAVATVLLLVVAGLMLAACGDTDTTAAGSPSAMTLPSAVASPSETPIPAPTVAGAIAFTSLVGEGDYDVCVVTTDGSGLKTLAGGPGCQMYPRWSPNGRKIVYFESQPGDQDPQNVWVMNADGSGKTQLTRTSQRSCLPTWSPDGKQIAYSRMVHAFPRERIAIYVINADGSGERGVTSKSGQLADYWPMWATDGRICFWRFDTVKNKTGYVYRVNPDGSGLTRMMALGRQMAYLGFRVSPDGKRIAFHDENTDRLVIVGARGGGAQVRLLDPVADYTEDPTVDVSWSPDGKALAIAGLYDSSEWVTRLFIVNADGTGLSAVPGIEVARDPAWRPE
jgi:Tol biopolymer transport system component